MLVSEHLEVHLKMLIYRLQIWRSWK